MLQMIVKVAALGVQLFFPITILACLVREYMHLPAPAATCSRANMVDCMNFHDMLRRILGSAITHLWSVMRSAADIHVTELLG